MYGRHASMEKVLRTLSIQLPVVILAVVNDPHRLYLRWPDPILTPVSCRGQGCDATAKRPFDSLQVDVVVCILKWNSVDYTHCLQTMLWLMHFPSILTRIKYHEFRALIYIVQF